MTTKIYSILSLAIFIFCSCGNDHVEEVAKIKRERDSVIRLVYSNDSAVTDFINYLAEIETGLSEIKRKENVLLIKPQIPGELSATVKENINSDIREINKLMAENKRSIEELNNKLKRSQFRAGKLDKIISALNEQLLEKNRDLERLNSELIAKTGEIEELNTSVTTLIMQGNEKSDSINRQHRKLNEAYYIVGDYKELRDKNVVDSKGGFLGLGKEKMLKENFNTGPFTLIDIEKTTELPLNGKNAKLITNHPANSYMFEKNNKKEITGIEIIDPENFWRTSKYLVVLVN